MDIRYLGTAAAEGIPAIFCNCERCVRSREIGGRALRTRSQAIIDGELLIDFPSDTYAHVLREGIDLTKIHHCLITHKHQDHLYPEDINMLTPGFATLPNGYKISFYGSDIVGEYMHGMLNDEVLKIADFNVVTPFVPFKVGRYTVTALPARHDKTAGPVFYQISDGEKTMLYAHDTHFFFDSVWNFWKENPPHFDFVSLDCTSACKEIDYIGHMSIKENAEVRKIMLERGYADEKTIFVCNHFSHNGTNVVYDDFVPIAAEKGFLVSYDEMLVRF